MMNVCNQGMMAIAEMYDNYQKSVLHGCRQPDAWLSSLTGKKREFCLLLQERGGRRSRLTHGTIVCYVEMLSACSSFVQHFLKIKVDFYELSNRLDIERLFTLMADNDFYQHFSNMLSGNPRTVINRYLDFIH